MKQLLKREAEAQQAAATGDDSGATASTSWFADALLQHADGALATWAGSNRGAFVVSALEQVPSTSAGVRKAFEAKAARAKLVKDAKAGSTMGVKVLAEQLGFGDFGAKEAAAASEAAQAKRMALKKKKV